MGNELRYIENPLMKRQLCSFVMLRASTRSHLVIETTYLLVVQKKNVAHEILLEKFTYRFHHRSLLHPANGRSNYQGSLP